MMDLSDQSEHNVDYLQSLIKEFGLSNDEKQQREVSLKLLNLCDKLTANMIDDHKLLVQIHTSSITLWNLAVAMRTGDAINNLINARVRHVACHLTYAANKNASTRLSLGKVLAMAVKAGRAWLDCRDYENAQRCFTLASEVWQRISDAKEKRENANNGDNSLHIQELDENALKLFAYKAETASLMNSHDLALECMVKAEDFLKKYPRQVIFLASVCYNLGLEAYDHGNPVQSEIWLSKSHMLIKDGKPKGETSMRMHGTTLRLLAKVYSELGTSDNMTKALETIEKAIKEDSNPKAYYLKIKIMFMASKSDEMIGKVLDEIIQEKKIDVDSGLTIANLLNRQKRGYILNGWLEKLLRICSDHSGSFKIHVYQLRMALSKAKTELAYRIMEEAILPKVKSILHLDPDSVRNLNVSLWGKAAEAHDAKNFQESLRWYSYSQELFNDGEKKSKNWAKLQRNIASCLIEMSEHEKAENILRDTEVIERSSPYAIFLRFKNFLLNGNHEKASSIMDRLTQLVTEAEDKDVVHGFICLAAKMAFEDGNRNLAIKGLESLLTGKWSTIQSVTVLRCLTRLKYSCLVQEGKEDERKTIWNYIQVAFNILRDAKAQSETNFIAEVGWFVKISWNLALQSKGCCRDMLNFFLICFQFSQLLPAAERNESQQRSCLVMVSAATLQEAKDSASQEEKLMLCQQALNHIEKAKELVLPGLRRANNDKLAQAASLLFTHEFEAKARLGLDQELSVLINDDLFEDIHPKTYETVASIALELSDNYESIAIQALRIAANRYVKTPEKNFADLSKVFHGLIEVMIRRGSCLDKAKLEECYETYQEAISIIETDREGGYPEIEIVWLMTRAWNNGIQLYSVHQFAEAERWCGMALNLLNKLKALKSHYEQHMSNVYSEILIKMQQGFGGSNSYNEE